MTRFIYKDPSRFICGLPTCDFDDEDLLERDRELIPAAVEAGLYEPEDKTPHGRTSADKPAIPIAKGSSDDSADTGPEGAGEGDGGATA